MTGTVVGTSGGVESAELAGRIGRSVLEDRVELDTTVGTTVEGTGNISTSDVVGAGEPVD